MLLNKAAISREWRGRQDHPVLAASGMTMRTVPKPALMVSDSNSPAQLPTFTSGPLHIRPHFTRPGSPLLPPLLCHENLHTVRASPGPVMALTEIPRVAHRNSPVEPSVSWLSDGHATVASPPSVTRLNVVAGARSGPGARACGNCPRRC